jgi:putative membrane protein
MTLTTAATPVSRDFSSNRLLQGLALICLVVWTWSAINPVDRSDWLLENWLLFAGAALVIGLYHLRPISDVAHIFVTMFFVMHCIGAHYTYSEVPLGFWVQDMFGLGRNHYDRAVHFSFGFLLTYPVRELLVRAWNLRGGAAYFFPFAVMVASSEIYELIEWAAAEIVSPETGIAFLGTQGDVFDAQKDTALAMLGTMVTLALIAAMERGRRSTREYTG